MIWNGWDKMRKRRPDRVIFLKRGSAMGIKPLKIGNLTVEKPIIQGGMGVGVSLGNLAGAVAKEGGIGIISAAQIGYREPDFDRDPVAANLRAIKKEYEKAREIAPKGVIGFNIMVALRHYEDYVQAAADAGADLIISGAGLPTELPRLAGESGVMMIFRRISNNPYRVEIVTSSVDGVANKEKLFPAEWINAEGNNVTVDALNYFLPLIQGEPEIEYRNGIPIHFRLNQ